MSLIIPFTFVGGVGNKARAAEVNANFVAVKSKFTIGAGGISDEDISDTAGIRKTKLSNVSGNRITEAQLEDGAVDSRVLKADGNPNSPTAAVNTANHIKDFIITNAKLVAGAAGVLIAKDRLKFTEVTQAFSINVIFPLIAITSFKITPSPALPAMSAMLPIRCTVEDLGITVGTSNGALVSVYDDDVTATPFYFLQIHINTGGASTMSGVIRFTYLALT